MSGTRETRVALRLAAGYSYRSMVTKYGQLYIAVLCILTKRLYIWEKTFIIIILIDLDIIYMYHDDG